MSKKEYKGLVDKSGFPVNLKGEQIPIADEDGDVLLLLNSNLLVKFPENSCIKFNPKVKKEVHKAIDTLVNVLTEKFIDNVEGYFTLDLTDEIKKARRLRTKEPLKIPKVQMYFDWIDNWLNYLGNITTEIEFKLLLYAKYKEKIKKDFISLETGLRETKAPKSYIDFAKRWLEETNKNIDLERIVKQKKQNKSQNSNSLIEQNGNTLDSKVKTQRFQVHNALFVYYLQECKYLSYFELHKQGKTIAIKEIVEKNNYGSFKSFQVKYNLILKKENRVTTNQINNLEFVLELLKGFPKAEKLASEELKLAKLKR